MKRKTHALTVTTNPNVTFSAEEIEEQADYCNVTVNSVDNKETSSGVRDQKVPSVTRSVHLLAWVTVLWITPLLIMSLRIYFTSVISENITEVTTENQQLKIQNQQLETQRNNLTQQIQNTNEQNVSRAQWTIDAYCPKGNNVRTCSSCQSGWLTFQSSCYEFNNAQPPDQRTWEEAQEDCRGKISDLAVIANEGEKTFTTDNSWNEPNINGYWIGLRVENGNWTWINGSSLTQSSWITAPTNNSCAVSLQNQGWKSVSCDEKNAWICEQQALSV